MIFRLLLMMSARRNGPVKRYLRRVGVLGMGLIASCGVMDVLSVRAEEAEPQSEEFRKGKAAHEQGDLDDAISSFGAATRTDPKSAVAWKHLGMALLDKEEPEKAIEALDKSLALSPKFAYALRTRGLAYLKIGESEKGFSDLAQAIQYSPDFAAFYADRAGAYWEKNMLDKAVVDISKAIKLDSKEAWHYNSRGQMHLQRKRFDKAIADFKEAAALNPEIVEVHRHLGVAYAKEGEKKLAAAQLRKYLADSKDTADQEEWKQEAEKLLGDLEENGE